jgi:EpsI family protein
MLIRAFVLSIGLVTASGLIAQASRSEPVPTRAPFATFPMALGDWQGRESPALEKDVLAILGVNDYLTRAYYSGPRSAAGLYVGYWESQRQGGSIHSPLNCLPGAGWEPLSKSTLDIAVLSSATAPAPRQISINRYVIQKGLEQQLVLYWYQSHGRTVASEYASKFFLVADAIRLNRTDAALIRVTVPITAGEEQAEAHAEAEGVRFIKALFPVLTTYLPS